MPAPGCQGSEEAVLVLRAGVAVYAVGQSIFSEAGQKSLVLWQRVPCEKAPSTAPLESIAMLTSPAFPGSAEPAGAVSRVRSSAALWGADLLQIGCAALGKDRGHCWLPELVASTRMIFPTLAGKTVLAVLSLASKASSGEDRRSSSAARHF